MAFLVIQSTFYVVFVLVNKFPVSRNTMPYNKLLIAFVEVQGSSKISHQYWIDLDVLFNLED